MPINAIKHGMWGENLSEDSYSNSAFALFFFPFFSKLAASFQSMEVRNSNFAAFIDIFTSNTYVMVVMSDPSIRKLKQRWASGLFLFTETKIWTSQAQNAFVRTQQMPDKAMKMIVIQRCRGSVPLPFPVWAVGGEGD